MDTDKLRKIEDIYNEIAEFPLDKRSLYLKKKCGADKELLAEIEALLEFDNTFDSFIDSHPGNLAAEIFSEEDNLSGRQVDRYRILSLLGKGGMGSVYLAEDTVLDRQVALKFLSKKSAALNSAGIKRFTREAKSASALNHPNIITVYDVGKTDDISYIAAEFIEGKTLRQVITEKGFVPVLKEVIKIAVQTAEALAAAHRAKIVHCDIKPENIMVRPDGYVKVLDFGLAKLFETDAVAGDARSGSGSLGTPGLIKGTVSYMSPEQARGLKLTHRTDIWSFGVMLYEILAGTKPFSGDTLTDTIVAILQTKPESLKTRKPELPPKISSLIDKTLQKNPSERFSDFEEVIRELKSIKRNLDFGEHFRRSSDESLADGETSPFDSLAFEQAVSIAKNAPANNLSGEVSPLIGRASEVSAVSDLLRTPEVKLVTLTGVGGTGKTRLARAVAHNLLAEFGNGTYFIDLSAIESTDLVIPLIARTLGVPEESDKSLPEKLKDHLSKRKILLVLDNFEQIIPASPLISELLSASTNLKILVTSRVRLNLRSEHEFLLSPLEVPGDGKASIKELGENPAVVLFVERAKAVKPFFQLSEENAQAVADICRKLDGLPLAIELAAVRIKLLAPRAILSRLNLSLKLLTGGARDLPERQQTMRGAIKWSYDLLEEEEKKLFERLAVFVGGFDLNAAEWIGSTKADPQIDIFNGIASLVDNNLLVQREQADGEPRFRMLEVVREFALEQLNESGEAEESKEKHAGFYAFLSETAEPEFMGAKAAEWFEAIEQEHGNIRSALEWSLKQKPETALRIAASNFLFWDRRGYLAEGSSWIKQALDRAGEKAHPKLQARACYGAGNLSWLQGDLESANFFSEKCLRFSKEIGDKELICRALACLAAIKNFQSDFQSARDITEESLAIAREMNDKNLISIMLSTLGEIARDEGNLEAARKCYEESFTIAKQESYDFYIPVRAYNLAAIACLQDDYKSARSYAAEGLQVSKKLRDKSNTAGMLDIFAAIAVKKNEPEKAARLQGAAQAIYNEIGYNLDPVDQKFNDRYESEARTAIGDQAFETAFEEGESMSLKKAIKLACETESDLEQG